MPVLVLGALASTALGVAAAGGITAFTFLGIAGWGGIVASIGANLVLGELSSFLSPKPKSGSSSAGSFAQAAQAQTQQVTQAITSRKLIYGETLTSGPVVYATSTVNNTYLHVVIALAAHEVMGIDEVWLGQDVIPIDALDSGGNVTSGKYSGNVRIKKHLGAPGQVVDSDLTAEVTEWTTNCKLEGIAYIYLRYKQNQTLFPSGIPNAAAVVRGRKIFDSRIGSTRWTPNIALFTYDYLTDTTYGVAADVALVDTTATEAAANSCEEIVTMGAIVATVSSVAASTDIITLDSTHSVTLSLQRGDRVQLTTTGTLPAGISAVTNYYVIPYQFQGVPRIKLASSLDNAIDGTAIDITDAGSGTHTITKNAEPRYFGGGVTDTGSLVGNNISDILTGMGGRLANSGGLWKIYPAVWRTATTPTLNENDLRAPMVTTTRISRSSRFNTVNGVYVSPANNWQPSNYPQVQNATYLADDLSDVLPTTKDLPFTQRASTAQRIATIMLNKQRQEIVVQFPAKLTALQFEPMDNIPISSVRNGWSGKNFELQSFKFAVDSTNDTLGCDLVLQETASADYDYNSGGEISVDPAPNTNLPDAFTVGTIVGLSISSISIVTKGGDTTYRATASWTAINNSFVVNGGFIHFKYRLNGATTWNYLAPVAGIATAADIFSGALNTGYDVAVWLENSLGIIGAVYELDGLSLGSSGGVGATLDWGSVADSVGPTNDYGSAADAVGATNDWGGVA